MGPALALALALLAVAPGPARADRLDEGLALLELGDYAAAQAVFEALAAEQPDSALLRYYTGVAAARRGHSDEAALAFARAAELEPELPWLQANLGIVLYRLGELELAEAHLVEALLQGPEDAEVLLHLGLIDLERGDRERAISLLLEAAEVEPATAALPLFHAARAEWARGDTEAARRLLLRVESSPGPEPAREQARRLLGELEAAQVDPRPWWAEAGAGLELDDNLTVPEVDGVTGTSDLAGIFDLGLGHRFFAGAPAELGLGYDFYQSVYRDLDELNYQSHSPSIALSGERGRLSLGAGYRYAHDRLGGEPFLDSHRINLGLRHALRPSWSVELGFEASWLDFEQDRARDATRLAVWLGQRLALLDRRVGLSLAWRPEHQEARDAQLDYWSHGVRARAAALLPLGAVEPEISLSYEYVPRRYEHPTLRIASRRRDDRHLFGGGLALPFARHFEARVDYLHVRSRSSLAELDYDENVLTLRLGFRL